MPKELQKRLNTQVRRGQIADAARHEIIKNGSEHVTIRRIAEEIGLTEGAIYRHFKSKREILSFLIGDIESNLVGDIERGIASGGTPLQIIESTFKSHISSVEQRRGITFLVIAEIISLGDKELNEQVYDVLKKYNGRIRDIISEGVESGEIRNDVAPDAVATLLSSSIHGLVNMWALSNCSFSLEERCLSMWNMLREAIVRR
ncbi:MAG: TetR/AcrR family transcriptional regulator [Dehalococcoidia bacterium]|nr:TetR/AcrR family transcriptional regulator [Dehalococcoidia bacterium]